jgi:hypothetical protein
MSVHAKVRFWTNTFFYYVQLIVVNIVHCFGDSKEDPELQVKKVGQARDDVTQLLVGNVRVNSNHYFLSCNHLVSVLLDSV